MDFLNTLTNMFSGSDTTQVLSDNTGVSAESTSKVISSALPKLVQAMTDNASTSEGASSLLNALGQHHTEKSLQDQLQNADTEDGGKIIGHILGSNEKSQLESIAADSSLSTGQISSILSNVAPAILSTLSSVVSSGNSTDNDGGSVSGLQGLLSAFKN